MNLPRRLLRNLTLNPALHAATTATVALSFLVLMTLALIYHNLESAIEGWQRDFRVVVVLRAEPLPGTMERLRSGLSRLPGVTGYQYVSGDEALAELKTRLASVSDRSLSLLSANPLPPSFRLTVDAARQDPASLKAIAAGARTLPGVSEVRYGERWAARFHSFFRLFKLIAGGLSALLFLSSAFIISNQVRLAVALRKEQLELLRMLGAGTTYLAAPYLLEGVLLGLAGSGAALAAVFGLYRLTLSQAPAEVAAIIAGTSFLPPEAIWVFLLAGASAGLLGSLVSLRRLL